MWLYNKGVMLNKLGRCAEALEIVLQYRTDDASADLASLPLLGELLCKEQRWGEAVAAIGATFRVPPRFAYFVRLCV